jgi:hypothetical protein
VRSLLEKQYQEQERDEEPPSERTVGRAMAIIRQFHNAPSPWQSKKDEIEPDTTPKYLLYRPQYRQDFWFIDGRYLVKLEGRWTYSLCIIEGYSRTILAGMASEHQDLTAVLQILYAALSEYGCPEMIVSDSANSVCAIHSHRQSVRLCQCTKVLHLRRKRALSTTCVDLDLRRQSAD